MTRNARFRLFADTTRKALSWSGAFARVHTPTRFPAARVHSPETLGKDGLAVYVRRLLALPVAAVFNYSLCTILPVAASTDSSPSRPSGANTLSM